MQHYAKYDVSELETTHHLAVLLHTLEGSRHWTTGSVPIVVRCAILADEQSDQSHSFHWVSLLVFELALWAVSTAVLQTLCLQTCASHRRCSGHQQSQS